MFNIKKIVTGVFQENTYLVYKNQSVVIIDPGDDFANIDKFIIENDLKPKAILGTHGHIDHVASANKFKEKYGIPFYLNSEEQFNLDYLKELSERYNVKYWGTPKIDVDLSKENEVEIDGLNIQIIQSPGHSAGGVLFKIDDTVFCGDTIFRNSIGRTDLPGGNMETLRKTILENIYTLPDETKLYPGHIEMTTVGYEKKNNQYIKKEN
ncbi:MAG: MBL fold metallo-hydrolase [Candidatus Marinimicrobia bacterium]|nr:MBL fold metallo-hydrolase [Candidatus Neomarinimicrobiota bacterium]